MIEQRDAIEQQIKEFSSRTLRVRVPSIKRSLGTAPPVRGDAQDQVLERRVLEAVDALLAHRDVQSAELTSPGGSRVVLIAAKESLPELLAKVSWQARRAAVE